MRKKIFVLLVSLLIGSAISIFGSEGKVQFGLGLSFSPSSTSLNFPLNISEHFRLEPEIGFSSFSSSTSDLRSTSSSEVKLACGFFYLKKYDSLNFYGGIRLGLFLDHQKITLDSVPVTISTTNVLIGPAIGAEYFFAKRFSLGGEFQFNYTKYEKIADISSHSFGTKGLMFIRWYFN